MVSGWAWRGTGLNHLIVLRSSRDCVVLSFSQLSFNSMLLLPPADAEDTRPLFHISVIMNCFSPGSYITVIRQGCSEQGAYVGEFECVHSTFVIHGT